jgi:ABC-type Fe3+ transport system substrate-binding protein
VDGLLQPYQPPRAPDGVAHDPEWRWTTLDYSLIGALGVAPASSLTDLSTAPRLALADPERSEVGLSILLASLDRARQVGGDAERGWAWWAQRARAGLALAEDDAGVAGLVESRKASHALTLAPAAAPLMDLAPVPHAIGLAAASRNLDAARRLLDWLTSEAAAGSLRLSPWQAASNGLAAARQAAPALDIDWAREQYTASRRRWAQSGFGPDLET